MSSSVGPVANFAKEFVSQPMVREPGVRCAANRTRQSMRSCPPPWTLRLDRHSRSATVRTRSRATPKSGVCRPHPALLEKPTEPTGAPESTSQNCSVLDGHECQIYECHQQGSSVEGHSHVRAAAFDGSEENGRTASARGEDPAWRRRGQCLPAPDRSTPSPDSNAGRRYGEPGRRRAAYALPARSPGASRGARSPDPWPDPTPLRGLFGGAGARLEGLRLLNGRFVLKAEPGDAALQILVPSGRVFGPADGIVANTSCLAPGLPAADGWRFRHPWPNQRFAVNHPR